MPPPVTTDPVEPGAPAPRGRIVLAAALGGAGLGLCIGSPLWARHTKHAYDDAVAAGEMPSTSSARLKQHVATGMFVAGAAAVGVAAYLYFTKPASSTSTAVVPVIDGTQVGLALSGSLYIFYTAADRARPIRHLRRRSRSMRTACIGWITHLLRCGVGKHDLLRTDRRRQNSIRYHGPVQRT